MDKDKLYRALESKGVKIHAAFFEGELLVIVDGEIVFDSGPEGMHEKYVTNIKDEEFPKDWDQDG